MLAQRNHVKQKCSSNSRTFYEVHIGLTLCSVNKSPSSPSKRGSPTWHRFECSTTEKHRLAEFHLGWQTITDMCDVISRRTFSMLEQISPWAGSADFPALPLPAKHRFSKKEKKNKQLCKRDASYYSHHCMHLKLYVAHYSFQYICRLWTFSSLWT